MNISITDISDLVRFAFRAFHTLGSPWYVHIHVCGGVRVDVYMLFFNRKTICSRKHLCLFVGWLTGSASRLCLISQTQEKRREEGGGADGTSVLACVFNNN